MRLTKTFHRTMFPARVIEEGVSELEKLFGPADEKRRAQHEEQSRGTQYYSRRPKFGSLLVSKGNESWYLDDVNDWFAAYSREGTTSCYLTFSFEEHEVSVSLSGHRSDITVAAPTTGQIERVMRIFNVAEDDAKLPALPIISPVQPPVVVFIGHGGASQDWRLIKDHIHDLHHYKIEAYEVGARAGHTIRDVVSTMMANSSFALLVMTGEDTTAEGGARARQNVVHETGLFQGRLGFNRAIAIVENGVEVFSNLDGVQQIRYDKGNVQSTFGEILGTLRREFGDRR
jgi:hypothetical protein